MAINSGAAPSNSTNAGWGWLTLLFLIALGLCALWIWADQQHLQVEWIVVSLILVGFCAFAGWLVNGRSDGILIDERNRMSLSRLQWVAWFIVLLGGYFAAAVWNVAYTANWTTTGHFPNMQPDLWALLGIVSFSAVASNLITDRKKSANGQSGNHQSGDHQSGDPTAPAQTASPQPGQPDQIGSLDRNVTPAEASWADLFLGEEVANRDVVDISRLQKLFVTILLLITYIRLLWMGLGAPPSTGIDMPPVTDPQGGQGFLWLLGISHAAYLAYKAAPKSGSGATNGAATDPGQPASGAPTSQAASPAAAPAADEARDGCDIDFKASPTSDEELPVATGGVA